MSLYGRTYSLRMPPPMVKRIEELRAEFPALPMALLLKCALRSVLELPREKRIKVIETQLRKPPPED